MACLETTFIIDLLRGNHEAKSVKDELDDTETRLCIASPSVMELWNGALIAKESASEKKKINDLIESLEVLSLDAQSAKEAAEIQAELNQKGHTIQIHDTMIAAIARMNGEKLVTRDQDYARIPGLKLLKY